MGDAANGNRTPMDPRLEATLGEVDHRRVQAPYLRLISRTEGEGGDQVWLWDLRFTQPNREHIEMAAVHSLEHMIAVFVRRHLPGFLHFGPMGCQTGFYLAALNFGEYDAMVEVVARTLGDCLEAKEVPLANIEQCGWAENHSLEKAQALARRVLEKRGDWQKVFA